MKSAEELDHYEVLEVPRDARAEEVARAFSLMRATYEGDSLAAYSVFDADEAKRWLERIDEAWSVLSDEVARRRYDAELAARGVVDLGESAAPVSEEAGAVPESPAAAARARLAAARATRAVRPPLPIEDDASARPSSLPRELEAFDEEQDPEAAWDGARLRRSRLVRGVELEAMAAATKITPTYLRFLEEDRFDDLPAAVYVRGFVAAYARHLGLDAARAAHSYGSRFEEHRRARSRARGLDRR
jgi:flagellar biosynthesis protein FlhG